MKFIEPFLLFAQQWGARGITDQRIFLVEKPDFVILSAAEGSQFVLSGDPSTSLRMTK